MGDETNPNDMQAARAAEIERIRMWAVEQAHIVIGPGDPGRLIEVARQIEGYVLLTKLSDGD